MSSTDTLCILIVILSGDYSLWEIALLHTHLLTDLPCNSVYINYLSSGHPVVNI